MDCREFRKNINACLKNELDDSTVNDFLNHLDSCGACREELEISFIVDEGVKILDSKEENCNMIAALRKRIQAAKYYINNRKGSMKFFYCFDTLVFWCVIVSMIMFFRMVM